MVPISDVSDDTSLCETNKEDRHFLSLPIHLQINGHAFVAISHMEIF